ncbi:MAG: Hpt domain-containing protein [Pirellula sp.]
MALKATDGDVDLLTEVVEAFLSEYPSLLAELDEALESGNCEVVQRASHTIKGSLRLFGEVPSRSFAETLEEMGASGHLENAAAPFQSLSASLNLLREQLLVAIKNLNDRFSS